MSRSEFKTAHSIENRQAEAHRIRSKYPDRVPIIVEKFKNTSLPEIDKKKYLVPNELSVAQFIYVIRKRIRLEKEQSLFLFVGNSLAQSNVSVGELYASHRDKDGFMYITYSAENTMG